MPIAFITLKMVFVLAWTTGDASNLSWPALYQAHFGYGSMSSGIERQSKFSSLIRCGTTEKVASLELWFHASAICNSYVWCIFRLYVFTELFWKLSGC
jgi:hypothetical protein